jgi:hypothetical protein
MVIGMNAAGDAMADTGKVYADTEEQASEAATRLGGR